MTAGTGHNPMLYTAANFGNLFGRGNTTGTPAPTPVPQPTPDLAQRVPLNRTPLPPTGRPVDTSYGPQQTTPIDKNNPLPWQGPVQGPPQATPWQANTTDQNNPMPWPAAGPGHYPVWGPPHAGGSPANAIIDNPSQTPAPTPSPAPSNDITIPQIDVHPWDRPIDTSPAPPPDPNQPSPKTYAHPWDAPMSMNQPANLPGSMFASAQNLINYLFPSATG